MNKSQKLRLTACDDALKKAISISEKWYAKGISPADDGVLFQQITALKNIKVVLGGVVDESKV